MITILGTPQEATQNILNRKPLKFHVTFPYRYPIPKVIRIVYDNQLLCTGPEGTRSDSINLNINLIDFSIESFRTTKSTNGSQSHRFEACNEYVYKFPAE